jgi:signal transduction histidine kinase
LGSAYAERGEQLRREQPWRRELVDAITLPALLFDAGGHLLAANQAARETFGTVRAEALTALQALGSTALAEAVNLAQQSERPVELEAQLSGGREVYGVASPVGDETLLIVSDRTAQRRLGEMRRDFVANASHELKSPVAGIQALAEALRVTADRDPSRVGELIDRLTGEAERLSKLVHDLLDLRRLESEDSAGATAIDLVAVVRDRAAEVSAMAEAREVALDLQLPDQAIIAGIEDDLRVAVGNLLDNAVRYNRPGGRVSVSLDRSGGTYVLRVDDTGIGIATQDLDRVFERFYRVDVARSRASGGTGLGLALVRHAAERQGGTVSVESLLGEGSSFTLLLPIEARAPRRPADGTRARGR